MQYPARGCLVVLVALATTVLFTPTPPSRKTYLIKYYLLEELATITTE